MDCMRSQRMSVWIPFVMSVCCDVALLWHLMTDITDPGIFIILIAAIGSAFATVLNGYRYPFVRFMEDGVLVRRFFRTVKYGWQDFIQVGVARLKNG